MNDITYRPFIRDSALGDINIQIPNLEIPVYKPRYSQPLEDDTETEVQSQVEEIRNPEPIVQETTVHKFKSKKDFKDTMLPIYERLLKSKGLNPAFAKSLVAQDGLESAWGSKPAGSYNFGGIKGKGTTKRTREVINGKDVYINDQFRNFKSLEDYANFKIDLLNNKRYKAFSGDIKEFANRVHRGGYATDPRYANILNQVIASAKHGGVLKFQQGGIQEGKQWLEDWYKSRKGLVKQNVKQVLPIPLPVTESLVFNALKRNLDLTRAKINPSKVPDNASGVYYPFGRRIFLTDGSTSTAIHEWTHSSLPDAQEKVIKKYQDNFGDTVYDNKTIAPDEYLDNPQEIYARLMQLRYSINADPNYKFTKEEIQNIKKEHLDHYTLINRLKGSEGKDSFSVSQFDKNGKIIQSEPFNPEYKIVPEESTATPHYNKENTYNLLNRYSDDFLLYLFNNVAQAPTKKKDTTLYAQRGLKIPKYQNSGVLRNAYNDPEHYYDYSKGSYDPDTEHWSDRDPVTGMELKNPNHPTAFMHYEVEQQLGNKRYQDSNGRYYTFPNGEAPIWRNIYGPLSETPGLKEVKYPSYGKGKANMEESIKDNLPRIKWIWNELINAGASSEQAAAILGNFWKENQIQPYGKASSKGAVGLAQLLGQRYNAYKEYLNNNNLIDSTEAQIKYLVPIIFGDDKNPHNLTGDYTYWINKNKPKYIDKYDSFLIDWNKSQRNAFRNAKGLDNLTIAFADNFERMGKNEADYEVRKEAARYIYNLMLNGQ